MKDIYRRKDLDSFMFARFRCNYSPLSLESNEKNEWQSGCAQLGACLGVDDGHLYSSLLIRNQYLIDPSCLGISWEKQAVRGREALHK